jgi:hypothetical protein
MYSLEDFSDMIFKPEYIDLILSGKKTQSRRPNRGYYKEGHSYAIQPCRTCKGILGYRIVMDMIRDEHTDIYHKIAIEDAIAEGGYTPEEFETLFKALYPKWNRVVRYVFGFHVVAAVRYGPNTVIWEER